jgi:transposase-like protein
MKSMTLSQREKKYLKVNGVACPFCGSTNLVTGGIEIGADDNKAYQGVNCNSCNAEWTDEFTLTGIVFEEYDYKG